ncbi:CobW family GTP-binding protein [Desmospora profundinema]|uniref:G3E family GTPase n=1 Tax=Desmospora profundinema TaxID=1571184 RepID=A0ABU1IRA3_9BACL|nr:GTP-binding protein [Desmospora profundinema]MDR6227280.1 G3E family GTPase [Desmospora profundinema]
MPDRNNVEIYILSGFLGSGKTTLLRLLLEEERRRGRRVAVLMNELGDLSVDSAAVPGEIPLKELLNGCICCTIQSQLTQQLLHLYQQFRPDVIYIESTGVAHPLEVLDACVTPSTVPHLRICKIVTVVDLLRWQDRQRLNNRLQKLLEDQVRFSDILLLNKKDQVTGDRLEQSISEIQQINPKAFLTPTHQATFDTAELYTSRPGRGSPSYFQSPREQAHVHHHLHVRTFSYRWSRPIHRQALERWLRQSPDNLYRVKGCLRLKEHPHQLQSVQYAYGIPLFTPEYSSMPMITVFIGENLEEERLKHQLYELETRQS